MLIRYGHDILLSLPQPTPVVARVSARPEHADALAAPERHATCPAVPVADFVDPFGNRCRRLVAPAGTLRLTATGLIRSDGRPDPVVREAVQHAVEDLPDAVLPFLTASRYCESDVLAPLAWDLFGRVAPGWDRVQAIMDRVHDHIRFDYQAASQTRTAMSAWDEATGVCRDFAHLAIAFARALNIPARYVNGHLGDIGIAHNPDPMDYAAWVEVFLGGAWHTFDPRNNARRIGRIKIAHGRDAADVPLIQSFGPHRLDRFVVVTEEVRVAA